MNTLGARHICPTGMKSRTGSQRSEVLRTGLELKYAVTNSHV